MPVLVLYQVLRHEAYLSRAEPAQGEFLDTENSGFLPLDVAAFMDQNV
jgi:hypothetical protein